MAYFVVYNKTNNVIIQYLQFTLHNIYVTLSFPNYYSIFKIYYNYHIKLCLFLHFCLFLLLLTLDIHLYLPKYDYFHYN